MAFQSTPLRRRHRPRLRRQDFYLVATRLTETNAALLAGLESRGIGAKWLLPEAVAANVIRGDRVLSRLDVRRTLDGVEDGIWELRRAERRGVLVLNDTATLLRSHNKLATAIALARGGVPHPRTAQVGDPAQTMPLPPPVVLKPCFGSWGADVFLCRSRAEYESCLWQIRDRPWFGAQGALVQELVPPQSFDLRVVVAGGRVVGAVERRCAPGEWRTNVALGGSRRPAVPCRRAVQLAIAAAAAIEGDLVGVDLLPLPSGDFTVLEVNGAVDFTGDYSLDGGDVFEDVAATLTSDLRPHQPADATATLLPAEPSIALGRL